MSRRVLLDTNVLIRFLQDDEPLSDRIESAESVIIHPAVYSEFMNGLNPKTAKGMAARKSIEGFLESPVVDSVAVTTYTSVYYTKIYHHLKTAGEMIPQNDIWIAASALEHGFELLTHDGHFARIPMLNVIGADLRR